MDILLLMASFWAFTVKFHTARFYLGRSIYITCSFCLRDLHVEQYRPQKDLDKNYTFWSEKNLIAQ